MTKQRIFWFLLITLLMMVVAAFFTSSQGWDLRHTSFMGAGLLTKGLSYYTQNEAGTFANYLPSTYLLTQIALLPATIAQALLGLNRCSLANSLPCFWEAISLKLSTAGLAFSWLYLVAKNFNKATVFLLLMPTVMYAWLLFGAYDGIGAFTTLIGGTLFFKEDLFENASPRTKILLAWFGLLLAALGIGAKFFPLPLFIGCALAYSKSVRKFFIALLVIGVITAAQIVVADAYGCLWYQIARIGGATTTWWGTFFKFAALVPLVGTCAALFFVFLRKGNSVQLGALAALASYALLLPFNQPHPQWHLYYGIALFAALATIPLSPRNSRFMCVLICAQGLGLLMAAQWFLHNADITMAGRMMGLKLGLLEEAFPATTHFSSYGRKILRTTLILSFIIFAYEWYKARKNSQNNIETAIAPETALRQLSCAAWAGGISLLAWHGAVLAMIIKAKFHNLFL
jgi:hypothetical protein